MDVHENALFFTQSLRLQDKRLGNRVGGVRCDGIRHEVIRVLVFVEEQLVLLQTLFWGARPTRWKPKHAKPLLGADSNCRSSVRSLLNREIHVIVTSRTASDHLCAREFSSLNFQDSIHWYIDTKLGSHKRSFRRKDILLYR